MHFDQINKRFFLIPKRFDRLAKHFFLLAIHSKRLTRRKKPFANRSQGLVSEDFFVALGVARLRWFSMRRTVSATNSPCPN